MPELLAAQPQPQAPALVLRLDERTLHARGQILERFELRAETTVVITQDDAVAAFGVHQDQRKLGERRNEQLDEILHALLEIERRRELAARSRDELGAPRRLLGRGPVRLGARERLRAPLRAIQLHERADLAAE